MNFKTTVILLVILLGVGGYVIYDKYSSSKDPVEAVSDSGKKLFDIKNKDDVNSLTIKSAEGGEIVLAKDDKNKWRMTKPVEAAAESWQVDGLVGDLVSLESRASVDPKDKGLDKPKFKIELSAKGGKNVRFAVGDKTQLGDLYVQVENKPKADVVSADVYERLTKPANDLRDKQLITTASPEIRQLKIESEGQKLTLAKVGTAWELREPVKLPVDESAITDLLGAITGLRAADWVAKDSQDVGKAQFDKPQMVVSFTTTPVTAPPTTAATTTGATTSATSQPAWTTITFGQFEDIRHAKLFARISDSPATVKVTNSSFETLNKKPLDLRDRKVLDILPEQVSKLSIATDVPAGAAPTTRPAKHSEVLVERRKIVAASTQATTKAATTQPATTQSATTQATTQKAGEPATLPVVQQSVWELKSDPKGDADDEGVKGLLADLHPLRASKYVEIGAPAKVVASYTLKVTTEAAGGAGVAGYELKITDPGGDASLYAEYNGLAFELPRTFLTRLEGNFAKKPKIEATKPPTPDDFKLPGEK